MLCIGLGLAIGKIYLRYATFEYSSRAILLIKDAGRSGNISAQDILLSDQSLSGGKSMDNEIQILKSLTLMEKVVSRLRLNIAYYRLGNFKETELYTRSPFLLDSLELNSNVFGVNYLIELGDYNSFVLKKNEEDTGFKCFFGIPFQTDKGSFTINLNPRHAVVKGDYRLQVSTTEARAFAYRGRLKVERIGDQNQSSVLQLSILDPVSDKASDIINTLIDVYNEEEIKDENKVLKNTLKFIDERVKSLVNELDSVEVGIQQFKSNNQIISENAGASMSYTLGEIRSAFQQVSEYEVQKNLLTSLENFLVNEQAEYDLIPANLIAENPVLSGFVNQYNEKVLSYKQIVITASEINPVRIDLEKQLLDLRRLILETIRNLRKDLQIPINEIEKNIEELKSSIGSVPGIEKRLVERMRTQTIKENLFLYLLQKREETALSEAVTTAKTRTIDRARISYFPVYPKPRLIMMVSGLIGLIIPFLILALLSLLETKVDSEETIQQYTSIPILGKIPVNKSKEQIVVKYGSRSAINEMFRALRTNLNFISQNKEHKVIMATSSISGEGKTFVTLNLGIALALSGKKVITIGMDLRKPKLATYLNSAGSKGLTNYLIGQNSLEEITNQFDQTENLFYITSGPIPPNPAELLASDAMKQMMIRLAEEYDYVLLDTPPIGLVSDALLLRPYIDNILVVVRQNVTRKGMLKDMETMYQNKELEKASIVFNGVKRNRGRYGYGGGYYYGNKNSYYVED